MSGPQTILFDLQRVLKYVTPAANISNVWGFHTDAGFVASLEKMGDQQMLGVLFPLGNSGLELRSSWALPRDTHFPGHQFPQGCLTRLESFPGLHGPWSLPPLLCLPWPLLCHLGLISLPVHSLVCWD